MIPFILGPRALWDRDVPGVDQQIVVWLICHHSAISTHSYRLVTVPIVEFVTIFFRVGKSFRELFDLVDKCAAYRRFLRVSVTECHITNLLAVLRRYERFPPNSDV